MTFLYPDLVTRRADGLQVTVDALRGLAALRVGLLHHAGHALGEAVLRPLRQSLHLTDEHLLVITGHGYTQHQLQYPEYARESIFRLYIIILFVKSAKMSFREGPTHSRGT